MRIITRTALFCLALVALLMAEPARAQFSGAPRGTTTVFVDPHPVQTLPAHPFGLNVDINFDGRIEWQTRHIGETLLNTYGSLGVMRFPGGVTGDNYDWKTARVIDPKRYPRARNEFTDEAIPGSRFTFDEFMAETKRFEARPFVILNALSAWREGGTEQAFAKYRQLAVDWVRYANQKGYRVTYWCWGNEPQFFIKEEAGRGFTLEAFARAYAREFKRVKAAIKAVDPEARVGIPGPYFNAPLAEQASWWAVLRAEGADPDFVDVHTYPGDERFSGNQSARYAAGVAQLRQMMGPRPRIIIGEFNRWWNKELPAIDNDLMVGELYLRFLEAGVSEMVFFPIRALKGDGFNRALLKMSGEANHPLVMFRQLKPFGRGVLFRLDQGGDPDIYGLASRNPFSTSIVLINRGTGGHRVSIGRVPARFSAVSGKTITGGATAAEIGIAALNVSRVPGRLEASLPPRSISIVTLLNVAQRQPGLPQLPHPQVPQRAN